MKYLLLLGLLSLLSLSSANDIYSPGPYEVEHKLFLSLFQGGLDHNLDVWAPKAEGTFPVIYFIPGLAGIDFFLF